MAKEDTLKQSLLDAPESQLDPAAKKYVEEWKEEKPTALELLKLADYCVYHAWASGFVMKLINILMEERIKFERTTYEELVKKATWRNEAPFKS